MLDTRLFFYFSLLFFVGGTTACTTATAPATGTVQETEQAATTATDAVIVPEVAVALADTLTEDPIVVGAARMEEYVPLLQGKRVAMVVNHTSLVDYTHLVDTLLQQNVQIKKIFAPEHGFRGDADAGMHVHNSTDIKTGLPIISLYGKNKKPTPEQVKDIDVLVFDIQDVGARFYTYISTMHYVMEAAAENNKQVLILDRPNPNGDYVDGPVLEPEFVSFVGMHPIPIVHGLTVGELALMINGEGWLAGGLKADVRVIPVQGYTHQTPYSVPVKPSPNLPNDLSIQLYPSLCLFEGTNVSVGRGTATPFQIAGSPLYQIKTFYFTPQSIPGAAINPPYQGQVCYGLDLTNLADAPNFTLAYLIELYQNSALKDKFFNSFFEKLAGNAQLRRQITEGIPEEAIRQTWEPKLSEYKQLRQRYLLYL
ncbi:MAG: DUF1343 domain-containing protein [Hymenobacteraceae bacterium]|nr:DUF1343 domain-containing protein [Hymenobacteraceae bacterium]MDX5397112.1 DUF1343 domain-containing protein [Hymenobacteraceae bacterium]MDX5444149.1 DUF1343 domain-containing protein [Hymenobacteraceae bacterium]MDX5513190.1 DUF1343 domain-containing protein [Hymenobacteraceae bacterium]